MLITFGSPGHPKICSTFSALAHRTWRDLRDSTAIGLRLREDSITDNLLLALARNHPKQIWIKQFTNRKEGDTTGADWEWWFAAGSMGFGMRVQAKTLEIRTRKYKELGKRPQQHSFLIQDARNRNLQPVYCFYNYFNPVPESYRWTCCSSSGDVEMFGCAISDAEAVGQKIQAKSTDLVDILPISLPWSCLVCCRGSAGDMLSLPQRIRQVVRDRVIADRQQDVLRVRQLPRYIQRLMHDQRLEDEDLHLLEHVDGLVIVREDELLSGSAAVLQ